MYFIRYRIFIVVIFSIPSVICVSNSTRANEKKKTPSSNFNAIDELSVSANQTTQVIREIIAPIDAPQENMYVMIERERIVTELQKKIIVIKRENEQLEATKNTLKNNCDIKIQQLNEAFNAIVSSLKLDMPEIQLWERRVQTSMLTRELVIKALSEATVFVNFLELKKMVLIGDINLLGLRENLFPTCQEYRHLLALNLGVGAASQPAGVKTDGGVKTDAIGLRSMSADVSKTLFDRKKILLDVKLEQESHLNHELKKFIKYYAGYCSRSVESMKARIELLRLYPGGEHSLENLKNEVRVIETEVVERKGQLGLLKDNLLRLVAEVQQLQLRYNALQDAADCFLELVRFQVDGAVTLLTESIVAAEQHTYQQEDMVLNEGAEVIAIPGPNDLLPPGPAVPGDRPFVDSESVEVSGDSTEEDSEFDNPGWDSRQQQEQIIHPMPTVPPSMPGLNVPEQPIEIAEPKRDLYSPPTLSYIRRSSGNNELIKPKQS